MDSAIRLSGRRDTEHAGHEHPLDVLRFVSAQARLNKACALIMITGTDGGAVRARGALMAVAETGAKCGYLSGGCIDADIAFNAQKALTGNTPQTLRYGRGSPFTDIKLPCGGGIDLAIVPRPHLQTIDQTITALEARLRAGLSLLELLGPTAHAARLPDFVARYRPKLKLRIAGIGEDPIALFRLALASGAEAVLWSQDEHCRARAASLSETEPVPLSTPRALPEAADDAHTAFILMAHDPDWEIPLLRQALAGAGFYIGAVGSPNTHQKRCETLRDAGIREAEIGRIHGPVGLVPSMRDASMLAISCLAEIIGEFHAEAMA
jgi:xanthine dehydrogenase accessory factor